MGISPQPSRQNLFFLLQTGQHAAQLIPAGQPGEHGTDVVFVPSQPVMRVPNWDITSSSMPEGAGLPPAG